MLLPLQSPPGPLVPDVSSSNSGMVATSGESGIGKLSGPGSDSRRSDFQGLIAEQVEPTANSSGPNPADNSELGRLWSGLSRLPNPNWMWLLRETGPNTLAESHSPDPVMIQLSAVTVAGALLDADSPDLDTRDVRSSDEDSPDEDSAGDAGELSFLGGVTVPVFFATSLTPGILAEKEPLEGSAPSSNSSEDDFRLQTFNTGLSHANVGQPHANVVQPYANVVKPLTELPALGSGETSSTISDSTPSPPATITTRADAAPSTTSATTGAKLERPPNPLASAGAVLRHPDPGYQPEHLDETVRVHASFQAEGPAQAQNEAFSLRIASSSGNPSTPAPGLRELGEVENQTSSAQVKTGEAPSRPRSPIEGLTSATPNSELSPSAGGRNGDHAGRDSSEAGGRNAAEKTTGDNGKDAAFDGKNERGGFRDNLKLANGGNAAFHQQSGGNPSGNGLSEVGQPESAGAPSAELPSATPWEARIWESVRSDTGPVRPLVPMKEIDLRLPIDNHMVDVQLRERAGLLDVSVRTGDAGLAREMQAGLGELVRTLESHGYEASPRGVDDGGVRTLETLQSTRQESGSQDSPSRDGSREGFSGGDPAGGQGRQQGRRNRQGHGPEHSFFETLPTEGFSLQDTILQGATSL